MTELKSSDTNAKTWAVNLKVGCIDELQSKVHVASLRETVLAVAGVCLTLTK